ncbi:hypothetical protein PAMP_009184 [Pampus punctatissimus]
MQLRQPQSALREIKCSVGSNSLFDLGQISQREAPASRHTAVRASPPTVWCDWVQSVVPKPQRGVTTAHAGSVGWLDPPLWPHGPISTITLPAQRLTLHIYIHLQERSE